MMGVVEVMDDVDITAAGGGGTVGGGGAGAG